MSYKDGRRYPATKTWTAAELGQQVTPEDIHAWMQWKMFEKDDPGVDDKPKFRVSTAEYWKKAISYFFAQNTLQKWNEESRTGNPTQSVLINRLIKAIKKIEIRGNGVVSKADRAFTEGELYQILELLRRDKRHTAMVLYQHHMIGRMDDICHVKKDTLKVGFCFCLHSKID